MKFKVEKNTLYLYFYYDLDHLAIMNIKVIVIDLIDKYKTKNVVMDFEEVSFIDSTGIGFVLSRYKQISKYGGELVVSNLSISNKRLFDMSGIFQIIKYERNGVKYE
ncbi:MAG: anti-sigma factor antagonist [Erysipelotrichaceae bacterium]